MYTCELLEPERDLNESLENLTKIFAPLYTESWVKEKAKFHGNPPFDMNVGVFANMWFTKAMKIIIAYKDTKPVGYLIGMVFRPLPYQANVFQVEDWYAAEDNYTVTRQLFDYLLNALKFIGTDEVWVSGSVNDRIPELPGWRKTGETRTERYSKA